MTKQQQDGIDRLLDLEHRSERRAINQQKRLLMKLNRAELIVLARHFGIKNIEFYIEPRDWKFGGKEELAGEIAEIMVVGQ